MKNEKSTTIEYSDTSTIIISKLNVSTLKKVYLTCNRIRFVFLVLISI